MHGNTWSTAGTCDRSAATQWLTGGRSTGDTAQREWRTEFGLRLLPDVARRNVFGLREGLRSTAHLGGVQEDALRGQSHAQPVSRVAVKVGVTTESGPEARRPVWRRPVRRIASGRLDCSKCGCWAINTVQMLSGCDSATGLQAHTPPVQIGRIEGCLQGDALLMSM